MKLGVDLAYYLISMRFLTEGQLLNMHFGNFKNVSFICISK